MVTFDEAFQFYGSSTGRAAPVRLPLHFLLPLYVSP